jgi:hypothetical protein
MNDLFLTTTKDKTLRLLQELETGALVEIDRICRKHCIEYSLGGGTCLGQVRHGGFIPWDDDIDVDMTIDNYERFMEIAPAELEGTNYYLLSRSTDPSYKRSHSRLVVKDTSLNLRSNIMNGLDRGVFIDIFCWNYLPDNKILRKAVTTTLYYTRCAIKLKDSGNLEPTLPPKGRDTVRNLDRLLSYEILERLEYKLNHLYKEPTGWFMEDVTVKGNFGGYPTIGMDEYKDVRGKADRPGRNQSECGHRGPGDDTHRECAARRCAPDHAAGRLAGGMGPGLSPGIRQAAPDRADLLAGKAGRNHRRQGKPLSRYLPPVLLSQSQKAVARGAV